MSDQKLAAAARSRARAARFRQLAISFTLENDSAVAMREAQFSDVEAERLELESIIRHSI